MVEGIVAVLGALAAMGLAAAVIWGHEVAVLKRERDATRARREGLGHAIARLIHGD